MEFFSRSGQDQFLFHNFFRGKRRGVFVDAGTDEKFSNTLFFERSMGWTGVRDIPVRGLAALLAEHGMNRVDYCSIGAADPDILAALDLERVPIAVLTIGNVAGNPRFAEVMASKGYQPVVKSGQDDVYARRGVKRLPRTSVICAVWHGDPDRHALLRGHAENLRRQNVPVAPIYVFDNGDEPPLWLDAQTICVRAPLTIYQAWNVALSLVETPLAMNLNLDDRLAPDAIEILETALMTEGAAAAGGDWNICYSQADTDAVVPCYPASRLPFDNSWPPLTGSVRRLGSSDAGRVIGPVTIWRMDAHLGAPRFPWRFQDGSLIHVAGDTAWWYILEHILHKKIARVPMIIGNYHSHPQGQAEFRKPGEEELRLLRQLGPSLL